jgi:hypothetical protein
MLIQQQLLNLSVNINNIITNYGGSTQSNPYQLKGSADYQIIVVVTGEQQIIFSIEDSSSSGATNLQFSEFLDNNNGSIVNTAQISGQTITLNIVSGSSGVESYSLYFNFQYNGVTYYCVTDPKLQAAQG